MGRRRFPQKPPNITARYLLDKSAKLELHQLPDYTRRRQPRRCHYLIQGCQRRAQRGEQLRQHRIRGLRKVPRDSVVLPANGIRGIEIIDPQRFEDV